MARLHLNVKVLLATSAALSASMGLAYPFFSEYIYALTGSAYVAGLAASVRSVTCVAAFIAGGRLADAVGRKKLIWMGTALLGVAQLIYAASSTAWELIAAAVFEGLSYFYFPAFNAMIMDSTVGEDTVKAFTWAVVVSHLPYAATPTLGGLLRDLYGAYGLRLCLAASGLTTLAASMVRLAALTETLAVRAKVGLKPLIQAYVWVVKDFKSLHRSVKRLVALRATLLLTAINMFELFAVLYVTRYTGLLTYTEWGLIQALASLIFPAAIPISSRLTKPFKAYPLLIALEATTPLLFMLNLKLSVLLSIALLNLAGALTYSIERSLVAQRVEPTMRGRAEAYMNISFYGGAALGSMLGGLLYTLHPPSTLIAASALLALGAIASPYIFKE